MFAPKRFGLIFTVLCLAPMSLAHAKNNDDKLSRLSLVDVTSKTDDIAVAIGGSKAPDFTSFTMSDPFRVVVDWAGSRLDGVTDERSFDRGLVRKVSTKQFDSEAEQISRVTIELAQKTAYRVEADGTRVIVHFVPVQTPIPEPVPEPEPEPEPVEKAAEVAYVPEGPLTEPDLPIPEKAPVVVAAVAPKAPEPQTVAPAEIPDVPLVAPRRISKPVAAPVQVAEASPAPAPAPAPTKVAPSKIDMVAAVVAPDAPTVPDGAPLTEPVMVESKPAPIAAKAEPEPVKLAKFVPTEPAEQTSAPQRVEPAKVSPPKVDSPMAAAPQRRAAPQTQRLASQPTLTDRWQPPGVPVKPKSLPVVRLAQAETLQPERSTPADAEAPIREARPPPVADGTDPNESDPGPRVMKYIGFRQMADVSRVFVRLDGKAKFRQVSEGTNFALELVDTSVKLKNNTRPLDTTYFNSPVTKVQAVSSGGSTRIEVELRENVPYKVKRIGTTIAIDFTRR